MIVVYFIFNYYIINDLFMESLIRTLPLLLLFPIFFSIKLPIISKTSSQSPLKQLITNKFFWLIEGNILLFEFMSHYPFQEKTLLGAFWSASLIFIIESVMVWGIILTLFQNNKTQKTDAVES